MQIFYVWEILCQRDYLGGFCFFYKVEDKIIKIKGC